MIKLFSFMLLGLVMVLPTGCGRDVTPTSPEPPPAVPASNGGDAEMAAAEVILTCGWDFDPEVALPARLAGLLDKNGQCLIQDFQREVLVGDIVHYSLVLSVGPGEHDVIGLHRVIRERRPYVPIRTPESLFLVHGMGKDFTGNFLPGRKSPLLPDDFGFAVFMAQHDLDVWGIDNSYTLVPFGVEDFSFAAGWGMDKSVDDIETGVGVARLVRLFTGNGLRKLTLVGYSQGAIMSYAFLNRETQVPRGRRSVGAFVPVDWGLGFDNAEVQANECEFLSGYLGLLADGIYGMYDDPDGFYNSLGTLAQTDPSGLSPYFEGFTNLEVFLFYTTTATPPATVHYWAASFDDEGTPVDLSYTTPTMATEFWIHWAPMHPPTRLWADFYAINCEDSPWETHLAEIDMPVFSLEAAGGGGPGMAATLDRLVNADVARHVVQFQAPEDVAIDFGHVDLFTAENATVEAWQPTLDWIESRHGNSVPDLPEPVAVLDEEQAAAIRALDWASPTGLWLTNALSTGCMVTSTPTFPVARSLARAIGNARWHDFDQ